MRTTSDEIESALRAAQTELPQILNVLSVFLPQVKVILPFLNLLPLAIQAVGVVQQATGGSTASATEAVTQHLTPGAPNAPSLAPGGAGSG